MIFIGKGLDLKFCFKGVNLNLVYKGNCFNFSLLHTCEKLSVTVNLQILIIIIRKLNENYHTFKETQQYNWETTRKYNVKRQTIYIF